MNKTDLEHDSLLDIMACAIMTLDRNFCVTYMNQAAEMLLGQSLHRMRGSPITTLIHNAAFHAQLQQAWLVRDPQALREQVLQLQGEHQVTLDCIVTPIM